MDCWSLELEEQERQEMELPVEGYCLLESLRVGW